MAVNFTGESQFNSLMNRLGQIGQAGAYTPKMKLPKPAAPRALGSFQGLPSGYGSNSGVTAGTGQASPTGGGDLDRLMRAIRGQESGGRYGVVNPDSGALGAYQILWSNLAANNGSDWDRQALGRDVSRAEFLSSPAIQDAIARYKLGQYLASRGMAGAAATWYGGDWGYKNMYSKKPQNGYPSMYDYVMSILNKY